MEKVTFNLILESLKLVWRSSRVWTTVNISLSLIRSFLPLSLVWLLKFLIDNLTRAVAHGTLSAYLVWIIIASVSVYFIDEVLSDLSILIRKKQSLKLEIYMYGLLHTKAVRLDLINFENPRFYDSLSRASREAPFRPGLILNNLAGLIRASLSLLLMAGLIVSLQWTLAAVLLVSNIPGIWLRVHYAGILYNFRRQQTPEERKSAYFNWLLTGERPSRENRLFGLGNYFNRLFTGSFLKQKEEELVIIKKRSAIELISNLFKASALFITLIYIARKTIAGSISYGQMAMFVLAFRQGMVYIKDLLGSMAGLYEDSLYTGDIFEFLNLSENIKAVSPEILPFPLKNKISVENLSFTYPGNSLKTINNVSFDVRKGEIVALVGPNGAGKSTLVRLLCRLYDPDSGTVRLDEHDIRNFDPERYRELFSVVFQDFMLYNLAAGENIRLGNASEEKSGERIRSSAIITGIHEKIMTLPDGYETVIGNLFEESRELSWGEWQKIALARALYREAPVLILDEPSSALDADTEYDIFNRFREIVKGRTSILISHRFTNVSLADRIIVLEKGTIAEEGTHDELMKKRGIYFSMYTKQSSRFLL